MNQISKGLYGYWSCLRSSNSPLPANSFACGLVAGKQNKVWVDVYATRPPSPVAAPCGLFLTDGTNWSLHRRGERGLPVEAIYHMAVDSHNRVWFATTSGGIHSFDGHSATVYAYGQRGLPKGDWLTSMYIDSLDRVWGATVLHGVYRLDDDCWKRVMDCTVVGFRDHPVAFDEDRDGRLWVACTDSYGADFVSYRSGSWEVVCSFSRRFRYPDGVNCFTVDQNDRVWVGTQHYGLLVWEGGVWHEISEQDCPLLCRGVQSLVVDEFGNVWAGAAGGFAVFDQTRWHTWEAIWPESTQQPVSRQDLLEVDEKTRSRYVYIGGQVVIDGLGRKWMETGTGVVLFSPRAANGTDSPE